MDSRNAAVRLGFSLFCNWGRPKIVKFDKPYKGGPTPLWKNVSLEWFKRLANASLIFLIACGIEFWNLEVNLREPEYEKE